MPEARRSQEGTPPRASKIIREETPVVSHRVGGNFLEAKKVCQAYYAGVEKASGMGQELPSLSLPHFFRDGQLVESRVSVLFPGAASPQWVLHQGQAGQEKERPSHQGWGVGEGV